MYEMQGPRLAVRSSSVRSISPIAPTSRSAGAIGVPRSVRPTTGPGHPLGVRLPVPLTFRSKSGCPISSRPLEARLPGLLAVPELPLGGTRFRWYGNLYALQPASTSPLSTIFKILWLSTGPSTGSAELPTDLRVIHRLVHSHSPLGWVRTDGSPNRERPHGRSTGRRQNSRELGQRRQDPGLRTPASERRSQNTGLRTPG